MAKGRNAKRPIKLVFLRSKPLTKLAILVVVVFSVAALMLLGAKIADQKEQTEQLRQQAISLEQENARLTQSIAELGSLQSVIRIAQEKLGLIQPDNIVIQPE